MNKQSSIPDFDSVQGLAKMAADEHGLSLAEGGLLGAGLGTGLGYLKHRVGEYLSPSGSEYAPKLQALQKQLGKPGKDQTQVKQQIAKIQEQQDEARRSSRNRNLLGGAAAGGSLGAYFTQRSRDQNEFRENTNRANRQRSAEAQAKENYDKVLRDRKFDAEAEAEKQFKARREADSKRREADIKNSTLPVPARTSTPSELSRKWLEETNTPTPTRKRDLVSTEVPGGALMRIYTYPARKLVEVLDRLTGNQLQKAEDYNREVEDRMPELQKLIDDDAAALNKKSSIQDLAKMAACGDACRCGQTENECTCSDVEKLARLVAKQASSGAWTRAEGKSESGGLNAKGRASLKAQGQNIKPPVTEAKPTGERAGRKSSFCARMGGMKKKLTSSETANDPDSRINKALRKWHC